MEEYDTFDFAVSLLHVFAHRCGSAPKALERLIAPPIATWASIRFEHSKIFRFLHIITLAIIYNTSYAYLSYTCPYHNQDT